MSPPESIVAQRCVLVLPSTGEFDSRTFRIASSLSARGHAVTVVARQAPELALTEVHPSGYRIVRVPVSALAGLPAVLRPLARRLRPERAATVADSPAADPPAARAASSGGPLARLRRTLAGFSRLAAIALTVRSQRIASHRAAP